MRARSKEVERELFLDKLCMVGVIAGLVIVPIGVGFEIPALAGAGIVAFIGTAIVNYKCRDER